MPGTGQLVGAAWSAAGQIALAVWRGGLYEVSERGGAAALRFDVDERRIDYHYPSWLPNGDLLYLIHWKAGAEPGERPLAFLAVHDGVREIPLSIDVGGTDAWPTVTPEGLLLFLREGDNAGIWAVPYDVRERRVSGEEFRVAPGGASLSASVEGSLLYVQREGTEAVNEMAWVDRTGRTIGVVGSVARDSPVPRSRPTGGASPSRPARRRTGTSGCTTWGEARRRASPSVPRTTWHRRGSRRRRSSTSR